MGQDYPLTRPSPGANRPIYPSFPTLASRSLPEGRIPKSHESFFFHDAIMIVDSRIKGDQSRKFIFFNKNKISDLQEKESGADGIWMCVGFVRK
jgi:hypothetical protein